MTDAGTPSSARHWVRPSVQALNAYHVPDAGGFIKLDAMENPYAWPDELIDEWLRVLRSVQMNRYPDPAPGALQGLLRERLGVPPDMDLLLGNGSDELIQLVALGVGGAQRTVMAPEPGFVMYRHCAVAAGANYVAVPLEGESYGLPRERMLDALREHRPAVVFLAFPNNPTGNLFDRAVVDAVIEASPALVVIDEAYAPFAGVTYLDRLHECPNLLVMRTLSKMGLAGLRLGCLCGSRAWLAQIGKLRLPYNINVLTQASVAFALRHWDVFEGQAAWIVRDRERMLRSLRALKGIVAYPSAANFILFRVPAGRAGGIFEGLRSEGILVKKLDPEAPLLADCLRVTVGTPRENRCFLGALARLL